MRLRFKRSVIVDVQKARLDELWDKQFHRWDEVKVEAINKNVDGNTAHIITTDGDALLFVPLDAYEELIQ